MIIENALSRIALGVHWSFDAFTVKDSNPALSLDKIKPDLTKNIGGVPLGLAIAEDIFAFGNKLAPKLSTAAPTIVTPPMDKDHRVGMPTVPIQPASLKNCADEPKKKTAKEDTDDKIRVQHTYPSGISPR